jgi:hypothetical protein
MKLASDVDWKTRSKSPIMGHVDSSNAVKAVEAFDETTKHGLRLTNHLPSMVA